MKNVLKVLILSLTLASSALAGGGTVGSDTFSRKACATKIDVLKENVELTQFQIEAGAAGRDELVAAQLEKLIMEFNCRTIVADKFCAQAPALAKEVVDLATAAYRDGRVDKLSVLDLQLKYSDIAGYCQ
jgi:hypothetical protein